MKAEDRFYIPKGVGDIAELTILEKHKRLDKIRDQLRSLYPNYHIHYREAKKVIKLMNPRRSISEAFEIIKPKLTKKN